MYSGIPCRERADLDTSSETPGSASGSGAWSTPCADTANDLADRVAATFDSKDVNALSGLFLWHGYRTRAAYRQVRQLQTMLQKPLAGLALVDPSSDTAWQQGSILPAQARDLRVEVALPGMGDATQAWRFPVVLRDGCYWLEYREQEPSDFP